MAQRTFCKDIFDFDCPITFCFNLRRSFFTFPPDWFVFLFSLFGKVCCFFSSLFFVLCEFSFLSNSYFTLFFLTWQLVCCLERQLRCVKMWSCVHYAVCKCYVLCASAVCCVLYALLRTMWRCYVLCAVCYSPCGELGNGAMCYVKYCVNVRSCAWWPQEPPQRHHMLDGSPSI